MPCTACNFADEGKTPRIPDGFKTEVDKTSHH
jgi:hypothetical protein